DGARRRSAGRRDDLSCADAGQGIRGGGQSRRSIAPAGPAGEERLCAAGLRDPADRGRAVPAGRHIRSQCQSEGYEELSVRGLGPAAGLPVGQHRSGEVRGNRGERPLHAEVRETGKTLKSREVAPARGAYHISLRRAPTSRAASPPSSVSVSAAGLEPWKPVASRVLRTLSVRKRLRPP